MKYAGSQHGIRATEGDPLYQMIEVAHTTRGYDRYFNGIGDGFRHPQFKPIFGAVPIHTR